MNEMQIPERCVILMNLEREDSMEHEFQAICRRADTKCSRDSVCERCIRCSAANVSASFNQRRMHYAVHNEVQCRTCILGMAENVCSRQDVLVYTCKVM